MQDVESHSYVLVDAAILGLPGHADMLMQCPDAQLDHQLSHNHASIETEVEQFAGCCIHALQGNVCVLGLQLWQPAFAHATALQVVDGNPDHLECVVLTRLVPEMLSKHAAQVGQSATGHVLAVAAKA